MTASGAKRKARRWLPAAVLAGTIAVAGLGTAAIAPWVSSAPRSDAGRLDPGAHAPVHPPGTGSDGAATGDPALQIGSSPGRLADLETRDARRPGRLVEAGLGLDAIVVPAGVDPVTRALDVPRDAEKVAWWVGGARPGDPTGTVVLAGHVDYDDRPGVFYRLDRLPLGTSITVIGVGGARYDYRLSALRHIPKTALPDTSIFRTDGPPHLALVTCSGAFDSEGRSYHDNLVALADPVW